MLNSVLLCLCTYYTLRLEHLFYLIPLQRKGLDSTDAPIASAKQSTAADSPASVDAVSSGEHKVKKAAALTLASSTHNSARPAQVEISAGNRQHQQQTFHHQLLLPVQDYPRCSITMTAMIEPHAQVF